MGIIIGAAYDNSLELDVAGEGNIEQELLVSVALHEFGEVLALFVGLEDTFSLAIRFLVQALRVVQVDFCIKTVLDAHFQGVIHIRGLVTASAMVVRVSVRHYFNLKFNKIKM